MFPIQIWDYRHGRLLDVSRRFPSRVKRDANRLWGLYLRARREKNQTDRGVLPAWAADEYLLGHGEAVWPTLEREASAGYLGCPRSGCVFTPRDPQVYIRQVRAFLRKTGYLRRG